MKLLECCFFLLSGNVGSKGWGRGLGKGWVFGVSVKFWGGGLCLLWWREDVYWEGCVGVIWLGIGGWVWFLG